MCRSSAAASGTLRRVEVIAFEGVVRTDYGQFDLVWSDDGGFDGNFDRFFDGQVNGLVGASDPCGIYFVLARRSGGSRVRIAIHDVAPPMPSAYYEDVVEVSATIPPDARVNWMSWANESQGTVAIEPAADYRVRVSAHGRDAGRDGEFAPDVVDEYRIDLWPATVGPDEIIRIGSEDAAYWHNEIGRRR
jgi:hypothetical protein